MGHKRISVSIILLSIVLIVGVSVWFFWNETPETTTPLSNQGATQETPVTINENTDQEPIQVTPSVITQVNKNTKLYTSTQFEYSFEYPQSWFIFEPLGSAVQPQVVLISEEKQIEGTGSTAEVFITVNRSSLEDNMRNNIISREDVLFVGKTATKIYYQGDFGPASVSLLIPQSDYTLVIGYDPADEDYSVVESILNSFAFTK